MARLLRMGVFVVVQVAAALVVLPAAPAAAHGVSADLDCTITVTVDIHPGEMVGPLRHHVSTSHGLTGSATCTGTVDGHPVTGPGRYGTTAHFLGNCAEDSGSGVFVLRIPAGNTRTVTGTYSFSLAGIVGDITGTAAPIAGVGDCVTTPLTRETLLATLHVAT